MTKKAVVSQLREHDKYERLLAATRGLRRFPRLLPTHATRVRSAVPSMRPRAGDRARSSSAPRTRLRASLKSSVSTSPGCEIVDVPHSQAAAETAVELVRKGNAELLMKGSLHSDELLGGGHQARDGAAYGTAHQPRVRHGRADHPERFSSPMRP